MPNSNISSRLLFSTLAVSLAPANTCRAANALWGRRRAFLPHAGKGHGTHGEERHHVPACPIWRTRRPCPAWKKRLCFLSCTAALPTLRPTRHTRIERPAGRSGGRGSGRPRLSTRKNRAFSAGRGRRLLRERRYHHAETSFRPAYRCGPCPVAGVQRQLETVDPGPVVMGRGRKT